MNTFKFENKKSSNKNVRRPTYFDTLYNKFAAMRIFVLSLINSN